MTTKEQERKALEQIKKIVAGLGEDSYIATAFEGCFEIAEENIENDFSCSMKDRWESAENEIAVQFGRAEAMKKELEAKNKEITELQEDCNALNERINKLRNDKFEAQTQALSERKEITIATTADKSDEETKQFARLRFVNDNGFRFVTVQEQNGWITSYKVDDLTTLVIE